MSKCSEVFSGGCVCQDEIDFQCSGNCLHLQALVCWVTEDSAKTDSLTQPPPYLNTTEKSTDDAWSMEGLGTGKAMLRVFLCARCTERCLIWPSGHYWSASRQGHWALRNKLFVNATYSGMMPWFREDGGWESLWTVWNPFHLITTNWPLSCNARH